MTEKAIIIRSLTHPDRETLLIDNQPRLAGTYNGVAVLINPDGSCSFTFNGPTDNNADPTNTTLPGPTVLQIKADGSFEFNHTTIDILADQGSGTLTVTTKKDCSIQAMGNLACESRRDANLTASVI